MNYAERRESNRAMRTTIASIAVALGLALGLLTPACETVPWACGGVDLSDPNGGELCHCTATGQLCDHAGFGACLECSWEP